jgi:hypothetical protein
MYHDDSFFGFVRDMPLFFQLFFGFVSLCVIGVFGLVLIRGMSIWISNSRAEVRKTRCKVVDKRTEVWGDSARTTYYITFEFDDRTRTELPVPPQKFGLIVVGDVGELTYRGTRFIEFARF